MKQMLTFEDVLLVPGYSDIRSRADIDISQEFLGMKFELPIISANMDYVTEQNMAVAMERAGGFHVLHRFMPELNLYDKVAWIHAAAHYVSFSVGVRNPKLEMDKIDYIMNGMEIPNIVVTVDVAHGHHQRVADMVKRLKDYGVPRVIAGNVATMDGYWFLEEAGADAVKVGIGPGAVCTTREVTGVGVPQFSAILDIAKAAKFSGHRVPIIADGGMKSSGDIVKALAAGADMVMLGSLLAGTDEAPGEQRVDMHGKIWRPYRGQSIFGVNGSHYTPEGVEGWVKAKGPVKDVLQQLGAGIRSGCSYVGARNLAELREKAEFIQITQAGYQIESAVRVTVD
jgi:IMP dehydrogenase